MEHNLETDKQIELQDAKEDVTKDAILAVQETENALEALYDGNKEEALAALEKIIGKFDILLALNPELSLIPIDARIETFNLIPVLNSQFMISKASGITKATAPKDLSDDKKEEALDVLKKAKAQIKIAELLGYGKKDR